MFNKIKEFFTGGKPAVETTTQEVPMSAADVAIKNIKETTAAVDAKVEVAPEATPACARPHEFAWNMGTTGRMTSDSLTPSESAIIAPMVWRYVLRWLYTTPFGLPVVPLV